MDIPNNKGVPSGEHALETLASHPPKDMKWSSTEATTDTGTSQKHLLYYCIGDVLVRPIGLFTGMITSEYSRTVPYVLRRSNGQINWLQYDESDYQMVHDLRAVMEVDVAPRHTCGFILKVHKGAKVYVYGEISRGFCFDGPAKLELNGGLYMAHWTSEGLVEDAINRNCIGEISSGVANIFICDYKEIVFMHDKHAKFSLFLEEDEPNNNGAPVQTTSVPKTDASKMSKNVESGPNLAAPDKLNAVVNSQITHKQDKSVSPSSETKSAHPSSLRSTASASAVTGGIKPKRSKSKPRSKSTIIKEKNESQSRLTDLSQSKLAPVSSLTTLDRRTFAEIVKRMNVDTQVEQQPAINPALVKKVADDIPKQKKTNRDKSDMESQVVISKSLRVVQDPKTTEALRQVSQKMLPPPESSNQTPESSNMLGTLYSINEKKTPMPQNDLKEKNQFLLKNEGKEAYKQYSKVESVTKTGVNIKPKQSSPSRNKPKTDSKTKLKLIVGNVKSTSPIRTKSATNPKSPISNSSVAERKNETTISVPDKSPSEDKQKTTKSVMTPTGKKGIPTRKSSASSPKVSANSSETMDNKKSNKSTTKSPRNMIDYNIVQSEPPPAPVLNASKVLKTSPTSEITPSVVIEKEKEIVKPDLKRKTKSGSKTNSPVGHKSSDRSGPFKTPKSAAKQPDATLNSIKTNKTIMKADKKTSKTPKDTTASDVKDKKTIQPKSPVLNNNKKTKSRKPLVKVKPDEKSTVEVDSSVSAFSGKFDNHSPPKSPILSGIPSDTLPSSPQPKPTKTLSVSSPTTSPSKAKQAEKITKSEVGQVPGESAKPVSTEVEVIKEAVTTIKPVVDKPMNGRVNSKDQPKSRPNSKTDNHKVKSKLKNGNKSKSPNVSKKKSTSRASFGFDHEQTSTPEALEQKKKAKEEVDQLMRDIKESSAKISKIRASYSSTDSNSDSEISLRKELEKEVKMFKLKMTSIIVLLKNLVVFVTDTLRAELLADLNVLQACSDSITIEQFDDYSLRILQIMQRIQDLFSHLKK